MKKQRNRLFLSGMSVLLALALSGCSGSGSAGGTSASQAATFALEAGQGYDMAANESPMSPEEAEILEEGSTASKMASNTARKVILNASFEVETKDFEESRALISQEVEQTGSYIEYSESRGNPDDGNAWISMTIRVPSDRYNGFKAFVPSAGNVTYSSEGGEDVTSAYFDTDTRLKVLRSQEERVLELLAKAQTVEELLQIETELTRIRTEIEQLTTQLKRYDDLVSYATIRLTLRQTADYTVIREETFLTRMGNAVQDSFESLVDVLQNLVIVLIWILPYALLLALIAGIILLIILVYRRKHPRPPKPVPSVRPGTMPPPPPTYQPPPPPPPAKK